MRTAVALLRGVNVGGRGRLPMAVLTDVLKDLGLRDVVTYVQSGNAVFRAPARALRGLPARIRRQLAERVGLNVTVLVVPLADLEAVVAGNPFPEAVDRPASLHVHFLADRPRAPDLAGLAQLRGARERFVLYGRVLYLDAPDGIARSRLAGAAERLLGVPLTGRNWRSVTRILELARRLDAGNG